MTEDPQPKQPVPPVKSLDFDPVDDTSSPAERSIRRTEVYTRPLIDGREVRDTPLTRVRNRIRGLLTTQAEREEAQLEAQLLGQRGVTRTNTIAVISPKGGVGKTTSTFLLGNILATHLKLRAIAIDANPDFGTLASLAPDGLRVDKHLADLLAVFDQISSAAELSTYVSRLPSGLHLLGAPPDAETMERMTAERYGELVAFLSQYYETVLLDLGTGITGSIAQFAVERADQIVVVTTPEFITSSNVLGALKHLEHPNATLVLNKARAGNAGDRQVIEAHFERQRIHRRITIPQDEQLATMLDSGTYTLDALKRSTRMPIKQLGLAVAEQLV